MPDPIVAVDLSVAVSRLPLWQRRYLHALAAGLNDKDAALAADVTRSTISAWTTPAGRRYEPVFARAEELVRHGSVIAGLPALREQATTYGHAVLDTTFQRVYDPARSEVSQDRNAHMVLEVAGAIGGQASAPAVVVLNAGTLLLQLDARVREGMPAPGQVQVQAGQVQVQAGQVQVQSQSHAGEGTSNEGVGSRE